MWVSLLLPVEDGEVLSHSIAGVLLDNGGLVLRESVDCVGPGLPVVLGWDVVGAAHLADNVVLGPRSRVTRTIQPGLTGETFQENTSSQVQADQTVFHFLPRCFIESTTDA